MREKGGGSGTPEQASVAIPRPAASVLLVRPSASSGAAEPLEVYMIRRNKGMKFLGGFYAFPGGRVDPADMTEDAFLRCRGLVAAAAGGGPHWHAGPPPARR